MNELYFILQIQVVKIFGWNHVKQTWESLSSPSSWRDLWSLILFDKDHSKLHDVIENLESGNKWNLAKQWIRWFHKGSASKN